MRRLLRHLALAALHERGSADFGEAGPNKRIAALGDSNTEGFGLASNENYPAKLGALLGASWTVDNYGVGGTTAPQGLTRFEDDVAERGYGTLLCMYGTNDVRLTADDALTIYSSLKTIWHAALEQGMRVIALTILPAGASAGYTEAMEERRAAVNALILSGGAAEGVEVVDLEDECSDGSTPPGLLNAFDGLHWNGTGTAQAAALVAALFT